MAPRLWASAEVAGHWWVEVAVEEVRCPKAMEAGAEHSMMGEEVGVVPGS